MLLLACGGTPAESNATTADIHCEDWITDHLGLPRDEIDFSHRPTGAEAAPSYSVRGELNAGGKHLVYQCDTTFDGKDKWTLDKLDVIDVAAELGPPPSD